MKIKIIFLYLIIIFLIKFFAYLLIFKEEKKIVIESKTNSTKRLPNALIIGVAKCGILL